MLEFHQGTATQGEANLIISPEELVMLANSVNAGNDYAGVTFKTRNDIDFKGGDMVPIGREEGGCSFGGIIEITNNTADTVTLKGYRRIGSLVGGCQTSSMDAVNISNNKVTNITIIEDLTLNNDPRNLKDNPNSREVGEYLGGQYGSDYLQQVKTENNVTATIQVIGE